MTADAAGRLREATAADHALLERTMDVPVRLQTRSGYTTLLELLWGFHAPIEERLAAAVTRHDVCVDWASRRKTAWLTADLGALGRDAGRLPVAVTLPRLDSAAATYGCLYVLEGATLGGAVIRTWLHRQYPVDPPPCRFFDSYGAERRRMWRTFCAQLSRDLSHPSELDAAVTGAGRTFDALLGWCATHEALDSRQVEEHA